MPKPLKKNGLDIDFIEALMILPFLLLPVIILYAIYLYNPNYAAFNLPERCGIWVLPYPPSDKSILIINLIIYSKTIPLSCGLIGFIKKINKKPHNFQINTMVIFNVLMLICFFPAPINLFITFIFCDIEYYCKLQVLLIVKVVFIIIFFLLLNAALYFLTWLSLVVTLELFRLIAKKAILFLNIKR